MISPTQNKRDTKRSLLTTKEFKQERLTQGQRIGLINLGCARNLVDSQEILGRLKRNGHRIVNADDADTVFVNTCSFIEEARKESIDTILDLIELKKQGKIKRIVVAGCLAQRYGQELVKEFKEVDAFIGTPTIAKEGVSDSISLTPKHFAYIKICESCFNACSFCAIPNIKGKFRSRTIESVVEEVKRLDAQGVREINIIGQDITAYGMDLYHEYSLAQLLKKIVPVTKNIEWIRLLYTFPAHVTDELIDVIAKNEKICNYIDMPLQHISDHLLTSMNRNITTEETKELIQKIRTQILRTSLRTTFIVGLPGERDEDFEEMLQFIKDVRFEKAGAFIFSKEEGTDAYAMPNQVEDRIKKKRLDALMKVQQEISSNIQQLLIGRKLKVLIEGREKDSQVYLGRSEYDAPDVDGIVYVHSDKELKEGEFVQVEVTDALEYDLVANLL